MQQSIFRKKLIILLYPDGDYRGGAQKRYLALFRYLQGNRDDFYLVLNETLYTSCFNDGILTSDKNIIRIKLLFEGEKKPKNQADIQDSFDSKRKQRKPSSGLRNFLGINKTLVKNTLTWLRYNVTIFYILKKNRYTNVYTIYNGGIFSWPILRLLKIRHIYSYNDASAALISRKWSDLFRSEYRVLKYADCIDFLSQQVIMNLERKMGQVFESRKSITPNSFINYNGFSAVHPKDLSVSFCSRLTKFKNPEILFEAIKILNNRGFDRVRYDIIGHGILFPALNEFIRVNSFQNILLHGAHSHPEQILSRSRIFVSIQADNNYPSQSLIEAMACENAIIASDVGETRLLVSKKEGILVPIESSKLADAIQFLIENPELCYNMGRSAREKVIKEQTLESYADYFIQLNEQL